MATEEVLHMNDGVGETSYANNSLLQRKVSLKVKPILKENITKVYTNIDVSDCLKVADLGCSSGSNTLLIASEIMGMIDEISLRLKKKKTPAFQIFLNDLPSNDFNTIFKSLPDFYKNLQHEKGHNFGPNCFILGAPGSFYGRLFPENSIHFFHSSYSLHWLSQVPKGLSGRNLNEGNIYIANTSCEAVWKAYFEQFEDDFKVFLKHRSVELVKGGGMVLTFIGRPQDQQPLTIHSLIGITLHDMVLENKVEEAKLDSFDLPLYGPSEKEVRKIIEEEASFRVERLEIWKLGWDADMNEEEGDDTILVYDNFMRAKFIANYMRAVFEPLLKIQFGDAIMDDLFFRFTNKLLQLMEVKKELVYTNLVISLTKN